MIVVKHEEAGYAAQWLIGVYMINDKQQLEALKASVPLSGRKWNLSHQNIKAGSWNINGGIQTKRQTMEAQQELIQADVVFLYEAKIREGRKIHRPPAPKHKFEMYIFTREKGGG